MKAVCIVGMVFIHVYEQMIIQGEGYTLQRISLDSFDGIFSGVLEFCGSASSFFVICLGVGIILSRRSVPLFLAKRGVILLLIGFALAFFTNFLPNLLGYLIFDRMLYFEHGGALCLLANDILIFAGLTFLFFAVVKKLRLSNIVVFLIGLGLLISAYFVPTNCFSDTPALQGLFGWIYWQDWGFSYFSFAQWIIFPIFGYLFGQLLVKQKERGKFYRNLCIVAVLGLVVLISGCVLADVDITSFYTLLNESLYQINLLSAAWCILFFCFFIAVFYSLAKLIRETKVSAVVLKMSRNITSIYCIHWVVIVVVMSFAYEFLPVSYPAYFLISIGIITVSYLLANRYKKIKAGIRSRKTHHGSSNE